MQENISELEPIVEEMMEAQQLVGPYKQIKKDLAAARKKYKALKAALVKRLEEARANLSAKDDKEIVLDLIREGMARHLERYVVAHRQQVVAVAESWWDKYAVPMQDTRRIGASASCQDGRLAMPADPPWAEEHRQPWQEMPLSSVALGRGWKPMSALRRLDYRIHREYVRGNEICTRDDLLRPPCGSPRRITDA